MEIKKGIILTAGNGTRLYPLTKIFNKSLLPVYDKPMIYYPLQTLKQLGCEEIMIVSGRQHSGQIMSMLGAGFSPDGDDVLKSDLDIALTYRVQEKAGGIAQALGICKNFAGPVYPGSINIKPIKTKNFKSLKDRINIYPTEISFYLSQWFKKIGVNIEEAHHTAGTGFQASRIYCVDMKEKMKSIKKSSTIADQLYGLPRNNINLNKLQSLLPASGFNKYFEHLENIWKENIKLKTICNPIKFNNKVYLNYGDKSECPNMLLWTANPTPLFKKIFDVKLDSNKHHAETLFGFLEKEVTTPFYIQVFSQYSNILRIYIYNINNRGCYTIEKAFDDTDDRTVVTQAQKIINNFFSVKLIKNLARKRSLRYFVYTVRDYELINHYRKNNNIDNLIFTNFLSYGRDDKVKSIIQKL